MITNSIDLTQDTLTHNMTIDLTQDDGQSLVDSKLNAGFKFSNSIKGLSPLAWSKHNFIALSTPLYQTTKSKTKFISLESSLNPLEPNIYCYIQESQRKFSICKLRFSPDGDYLFKMGTLGELDIFKFGGWNDIQHLYFDEGQTPFLDFLILNDIKQYNVDVEESTSNFKTKSTRLPSLGFSTSIFPISFMGVLEDGRLMFGKSTMDNRFQLDYETLPFVIPFDHYSSYNMKLINSKLNLWQDYSVIVTAIVQDAFGYKLVVAKHYIKDKLKWLGKRSTIDIILHEDSVPLGKDTLYTIAQPVNQILSVITCRQSTLGDRLALDVTNLDQINKTKSFQIVDLPQYADLTFITHFQYTTTSSSPILVLCLSNGTIQFRSLQNIDQVYHCIDLYQILNLPHDSTNPLYVNQLQISPNQMIAYAITNLGHSFVVNLLKNDFSEKDQSLPSKDKRLYLALISSYVNRRNPLDIMTAICELSNENSSIDWIIKLINETLPKNPLFEGNRFNIESIEFQWIIYRYLPHHHHHSCIILLLLQYHFTLVYWLSQLEGNGLENLDQLFIIGTGNSSEILRGQGINFNADSLPTLIPHLHWILNSFLPFYQQLDKRSKSSQLHHLLSYQHFRAIFPPLLLLAWKLIGQLAKSVSQNASLQPYQKLIQSFPLSLDSLMSFLSQITRYLNQKHPKEVSHTHWVTPELPEWSGQCITNLPEGLQNNFQNEFAKSKNIDCGWLGLNQPYKCHFPPHPTHAETEKVNLFYFRLENGQVDSGWIDWINKGGWDPRAQKLTCSRCYRSSFTNLEVLSLTNALDTAFEHKCICGGYWWPMPRHES